MWITDEFDAELRRQRVATMNGPGVRLPAVRPPVYDSQPRREMPDSLLDVWRKIEERGPLTGQQIADAVMEGKSYDDARCGMQEEQA